MPSPYTRVSLIGQRRNADALLPSDTPVGALLPQILDLLDDRPQEGLGTKLLVRTSGETVDPEQTFAEAEVLDGERLSVVSQTEAPPAPIVYDLNDAVTDATESVRGRWSELYRYLICGVIAALGTWFAVHGLLDLYAQDTRAWIELGLGAVLLIAGASVAAPGRMRAVAGTLIGTGVLFAGTGLWNLDLPQEWLLPAYGALAAVGMGLLGFVVRRPLAMFMAAAITGGLTLVWTLAPLIADWSIGDRDAEVLVGSAGIAGIITVLVLGMLPKIALSASGLASLDDSHSQGRSLLRTDADAAIDAAHGGLVTSTVVGALSAAAALWLIGEDTSHHPFSVPLLAALTLAVGLRARSFPLASERIPLYLATGVGVLSLVRLATAYQPQFDGVFLAVLLALALLVGSGLSVDLPEHSQARMRRLGDTVEALALFAVIPLLIGYFGIYATLWEIF
ncbi:type VII secretion integral membrane protein EccD [Micrococcus terreus]|uniref:type VII secretion integral membrane protein EccD n=1 Tax=Micrococcus terreus TaxID=574650 RepID=UPI0030170901